MVVSDFENGSGLLEIAKKNGININKAKSYINSINKKTSFSNLYKLLLYRLEQKLFETMDVNDLYKLAKVYSLLKINAEIDINGIEEQSLKKLNDLIKN